MEKLITASDLRWEIVRPGLLNNRQRNEHYRILDTLQKGMKVGAISRASVADFLAKEIENTSFLGKFVSLTD